MIEFKNLIPGDRFVKDIGIFREIEFIKINRNYKDVEIGCFKTIKSQFEYLPEISYWNEDEINEKFRKKIMDFTKIP